MSNLEAVHEIFFSSNLIFLNSVRANLEGNVNKELLFSVELFSSKIQEKNQYLMDKILLRRFIDEKEKYRKKTSEGWAGLALHQPWEGRVDGEVGVGGLRGKAAVGVPDQLLDEQTDG